MIRIFCPIGDDFNTSNVSVELAYSGGKDSTAVYFNTSNVSVELKNTFTDIDYLKEFQYI